MEFAYVCVYKLFFFWLYACWWKTIDCTKRQTSHTHTHTHTLTMCSYVPMYDASSTKWYNRISYSLWRIAIPIHTNTRTCTHLKCYYRINNSHEHHYFSSTACTHTLNRMTLIFDETCSICFQAILLYIFAMCCSKTNIFFSLFIFGFAFIFALSNASDYCYLKRLDFDCV